MSNVVFWRQVFLGASLFFCGGYPIIAAEVGETTIRIRGVGSLNSLFILLRRISHHRCGSWRFNTKRRNS